MEKVLSPKKIFAEFQDQLSDVLNIVTARHNRLYTNAVTAKDKNQVVMCENQLRTGLASAATGAKITEISQVIDHLDRNAAIFLSLHAELKYMTDGAKNKSSDIKQDVDKINKFRQFYTDLGYTAEDPDFKIPMRPESLSHLD